MSKPTVLVTRKWPSEVEEELKSKYDEFEEICETIQRTKCDSG